MYFSFISWNTNRIQPKRVFTKKKNFMNRSNFVAIYYLFYMLVYNIGFSYIYIYIKTNNPQSLEVDCERKHSSFE